ncbi:MULTISPECIES: response regulator [Limnochorda]|uniref:response regulator n=1 Tax=Limnochorda TaxID=1676651 RepID=UPI00180D02FF|nr:response regulator [Limnochorda pilosa]MBO2487201.1 two-component system response regulator [Bacillota bacterium]MBO2519399.1 two-component system response regulator [Bacillota bacterium]NMA71958.1 response regulator [Bacillota bacterium]
MALRVLVVDDTAFMRMTLRNVLERNGYEVVGEAATGVEAVELYQSLKPDLVTMDITMPEMDGITAIREIMKMDPQARIIVCSALGQKNMVIEALTAGAKDYLVKPFQPERVLEALEKLQAQHT